MVGADRYEEGGGYSAVGRPAMGESPGALDLEHLADPDSYWANIDYPPARPQFVRPPVDSQHRRERTRRRNLAAVAVAAAFALAIGSYAVGRINGHAPVPGLQRRIDALEQTIASQRAQLDARAATVAAGRNQIRTLRDRASGSQTSVTACQHALDGADHALGTESAAIQALSLADHSSADALAAQFGNELDQFATAARACRVASTSVRS